jgi:hypothetical protein
MDNMQENKIIYRCAIATGLLLMFASVIHSLNIGEIFIAIKTGDVAASYAAAAVGTGIFFGVSIFLIGVWILFLAKDLKRLIRKAWWQAIIIALALSAFGIICWLQFPKTFHFLYFLLLGLILLIPLFINANKFK